MAADTRLGAADDPDDPDPLLRPAWEETPDETVIISADKIVGVAATSATPAGPGDRAPAALVGLQGRRGIPVR